MIKKIYFVQQKKYYGYDAADDENIEEFMVIGYFTSPKLVDNVKQICVSNGIDEKEIDVQSFDIFLNNKKFIYVLSHMYSIKKADGNYTDYEYIFEPQTSNKKCIELIKKLKLDSKYGFNKNRIYEDYTSDGFIIDKFIINCIYYPIVMQLSEH